MINPEAARTCAIVASNHCARCSTIAVPITALFTPLSVAAAFAVPPYSERWHIVCNQHHLSGTDQSFSPCRQYKYTWTCGTDVQAPAPKLPPARMRAAT